MEPALPLKCDIILQHLNKYCRNSSFLIIGTFFFSFEKKIWYSRGKNDCNVKLLGEGNLSGFPQKMRVKIQPCVRNPNTSNPLICLGFFLVHTHVLKLLTEFNRRFLNLLSEFPYINPKPFTTPDGVQFYTRRNTRQTWVCSSIHVNIQMQHVCVRQYM